jgi:hypothetical protein
MLCGNDDDDYDDDKDIDDDNNFCNAFVMGEKRPELVSSV